MIPYKYKFIVYLFWLIVLIVLLWIISGFVFAKETKYSVSDCFITAPSTPPNIMDDIIECESKWDATAQNPISSAYGLCQFLNSTWEYVQKKWNMELDRNNPDDQLYACRRLFEEEGEIHWITSKDCWK